MTSSRPTYAFESPNVATVLRLAAGGSSDWPQYLPTALGAALVALIWWRRREDWNWTQEFRWLVILSCLATSYGGWPFDLVVLVIPIVAEAARLARVGSTLAITAGTAAFSSITVGALALHAAHVPQALFIWMAPSVAIGLLALGRIAQAPTHLDGLRTATAGVSRAFDRLTRSDQVPWRAAGVSVRVGDIDTPGIVASAGANQRFCGSARRYRPTSR